MKYCVIIRAIACWSLLFMWFAVFANPLSALDKVTLQLKWKHQFQFAGYYAALEKGYYKDKGLDVTIKEAWPGIDHAEELESGRVDFVVHLPDMLIERQKGKHIVVLAAIFQHSPVALFSSKKSGITTPQDLYGKRVMMSSSGNFGIDAMLLKEGIKKSQFTEVPHKWDFVDLINGRVDVVSGYLTDAPFVLGQKDFEYNEILPKDYGIDFYGDCLFTTEKEINEHPQRVRNFLEASIKGWEYAMSHKEEITDLILRKYSKRRSRKALLFEADAMSKLMPSELIEIGHMNPARWRHIADTFVKLGMLKPGYSLDGFIYTNKDERYTEIIKIVKLIGVLVVIALLVLFLFNRKLHRMVVESTSQLRSEKALADAIVNALPGAFFMFEDGKRLVRWNSNLNQISGLTDNELFGSSPLDFIADTSKGIAAEALAKVFEEGEASIEAVSLFQGKEALYYYSATLFQAEGKSYLLGVSFDLTEKRKLEEQLTQAQKIESIGRLAGGLAHDFNNVLTAIIGYSDIMMMKMSPDNPYREQVKIIRREGEKAATLTKQLLAFSRKQVMEKKVVSLHGIVEDLLKILTKTLGEDLQIITCLDAENPCLNADSGKIEQVITNLALNARDAMPNGGKIIIETKNVFLSREDAETKGNIVQGEYVMFAVSDTGEGMEQEVQDHIFEPFFTTKDCGKGTGLGLASVYGIVMQHSGAINVYSEKGKGTAFTIYLPLSESSACPDEDNESVALPEHGTERILIVDDEPSVRQLLLDTLEPLGYQCMDASGPIEALRKISDWKPDMLISDVVMPEMNGKELAEKIISEDADIKVILMSGYAANAITHLDELDAGMHFIQKPVAPMVLVQKIRSMFDA